MQKATDLTEEQWKAIDSIAEQTNCTYRGQPSWTKLLKRLALGQIKVTEVSPSAEPVDQTTKPKLDPSKAPVEPCAPSTASFGSGWSSDAYT